MAADLAAFRAQFPELSEQIHPDAAVERALAEAAQIHSVNDLATLYVTAHLLAQPASAGQRGEIVESKVGPATSKYRPQAESGWEAFFTSTSYGRRFLILERRTPRTAIGARVV